MVKPQDAVEPVVDEPTEGSAYILKTDVAALMLGHFPVQKITTFGLVGSYCLCGEHLGDSLTFPAHVVALLEGGFDDPVDD